MQLIDATKWHLSDFGVQIVLQTRLEYDIYFCFTSQYNVEKFLRKKQSKCADVWDTNCDTKD